MTDWSGDNNDSYSRSRFTELENNVFIMAGGIPIMTVMGVWLGRVICRSTPWRASTQSKLLGSGLWLAIRILVCIYILCAWLVIMVMYMVWVIYGCGGWVLFLEQGVFCSILSAVMA